MYDQTAADALREAKALRRENDELRMLLLRIARNPENVQSQTALKHDLLAEVQKDPRWADWQKA